MLTTPFVTLFADADFALQIEELNLDAEIGTDVSPDPTPTPIPPVVASGTVTLTYTDFGASALRVLKSGGYCDASDPADVDTAWGISLSTGVAVTFGRMTDTSWNWIPNKSIYCGADGYLTQTPQTVGFHQVVAKAVTNQIIIVNLQQSILL